MRLIAWSHLRDYAERHPETAASLKHWRRVVEGSTWTGLSEVLGSFSKVKACASDRVRFEIAGGSYRLIVAFDFSKQIAFVKFVGTHQEYDRIDCATVSMF